MKWTHRALLFLHFAGEKAEARVRKAARYFDDYVSEVLQEKHDDYEIQDFTLERSRDEYTLIIHYPGGTIEVTTQKALILGMQAARKRLTRDKASVEDKRFLLTNDLGL
ncbi:hypothetical protein SBP02_11885 [Pseudomonas benzenivorans]|uniref:Uncharacterized protein n=1 Tax=Pseudomonas benzenivorans TaxID=556533 RepID=A0ABZ0PSC5_9PSED|nr:hypothetical protein [Pseudomonas benzenivorans]WPC03485.1 hypothetical protein SBP02_11885 [Pseudomonas benzenivorans]